MAVATAKKYTDSSSKNSPLTGDMQAFVLPVREKQTILQKPLLRRIIFRYFVGFFYTCVVIYILLKFLLFLYITITQQKRYIIARFLLEQLKCSKLANKGISESFLQLNGNFVKSSLVLNGNSNNPSSRDNLEILIRIFHFFRNRSISIIMDCCYNRNPTCSNVV